MITTDGFKKALRDFYLSGNTLFYLPFRKREQKRMAQLSGIHNGETCVIVGNGPSLTGGDLDYINELGLRTFATNTIYKIFPDTPWRPTYYAIDDRGMLRRSDIKEHLAEINAEKYFFIKQNFLQYPAVRRCVPPERVLFLNSDGNRDYLKSPKFSCDVPRVIYSIGTVTYCCMQLAVHMGFAGIVLIGMDHSYPVERDSNGNIVIHGGKAHAGKESEKERTAVGAVWEMEVAYQCALEESKRGNFEIYNATRGGKLEIFPRIRLEEISTI